MKSGSRLARREILFRQLKKKKSATWRITYKCIYRYMSVCLDRCHHEGKEEKGIQRKSVEAMQYGSITVSVLPGKKKKSRDTAAVVATYPKRTVQKENRRDILNTTKISKKTICSNAKKKEVQRSRGAIHLAHTAGKTPSIQRRGSSRIRSRVDHT